MGLAEVRKYFEEHNIKNEIILLDANTATVDLAAAALGREPGEIAKTLSFELKDGTPVLIVVMGTARIDNRKYKDYFGCKAAMLSHDDALEKIGHAVGGVCPFGVKDGVKIYLDVSLRKYETVFPAAGTETGPMGGARVSALAGGAIRSMSALTGSSGGARC